MRRTLVCTVLLAACAGAGAGPPAANPPRPAPPVVTAKEEPPQKAPLPKTENPPTQEPSAGDANAFTLRLLARATAKPPAANVMVSGTSLRQALGAAYFGARGETARELANTLGFDGDRENAKRSARAEIEALRSSKDAELSIANHLWVDKSAPLKKEYVDLAADAFDAPAENVDFKGAPENARQAINIWVAQKTQDKIKELLPQGGVDPLTRLVVTNAIYFKGKWAAPFPKSATKDEPFTTDAKKRVTVPTMHATEQMRFGAAAGAKAVELPYIGNAGISMLVVLMDDAKAPPKLTPETVQALTSSLVTKRVALAMPRFAFGWGGSMKPILKDLGITIAFTDKADFGDMVEKGPLSLSDTFHKTWVAVDEEGTEAAAATGTVMRTTSLTMGEAVPFVVDRPFLFLLRANGKILFAGRVADPKSLEK